jgi:hypothetical protein
MQQSEKGVLQTTSDTIVATRADPSREKYLYVNNSSGQPVVADWMTALLPYLKSKPVNGNTIVPGDPINPVFVCPSDRWIDVDGQRGYFGGTNFEIPTCAAVRLRRRQLRHQRGHHVRQGPRRRRRQALDVPEHPMDRRVPRPQPRPVRHAPRADR